LMRSLSTRCATPRSGRTPGLSLKTSPINWGKRS
jgi:hypothetical protein